jgi:hypothetical protein
MKKGLLLASLLLAGASANAADLPTWPVKAPLVSGTPCVPGNCSGWYGGFGLTGTGTNADIIGVGLNGSVFAAGGAVDVHGGYQLWNGQYYAAIEGSVGYAFQSPTSKGVSVTNNNFGNSFQGLELVKLGYNFFPSQQQATTTPSQSPVQLIVPANFLATTTPYLVFGGYQRKGLNEWVNGAGLTTVISSGWSSFAEYLYAPPQQGENATQIVRIGLNKHF